jgi:predicted kinase
MYDKVKIWLPEINEYLDKMKNCQQDKEFHGEGDVLIHTEMVLSEVNKLDVKEEQKTILWWSALLHDIGKPGCSTIEDGHIRSHGHSRRGYHIAMELLDKTDLNNQQKIEIINLIRVHGEPNWILEKENPEREVIKMSLQCNLENLYYLVRCDILGRISLDNEKLLENLEYFKEIAKELNCFDKPFEFQSKIAKYKYLVDKSHHHSDNPFDDTKSKVIMVCGLPGSGKDFYIKSLSLPVISLDEIRKELVIKPTDEQGKVIQTAKQRAREYMRKGEDFIWNATNTTKRMRTELISFFSEYNSYIDIRFINKDINLVLEQNKNRDSKVPENIIIKLYKKLEIPTEDECHSLTIIS